MPIGDDKALIGKIGIGICLVFRLNLATHRYTHQSAHHARRPFA